MDTKKLILAIILSVAVLLVFQYFFMPKPVARPQAPAPAQAAQPQQAGDTSGETAAPDIGSILGQDEPAVEENAVPLPAVQENVSAADEQTVTVDGSLFTAVFTNRGAGLTRFVLKKYKDDAKKPMDLVSRSARESSFYPFYFFSEKEVIL